MSGATTKSSDGPKTRERELMKAKLRKEERARRNAEKRAALKLVSWNVNSFASRASDVDTFFAHEDIDILFACETKQKR